MMKKDLKYLAALVNGAMSRGDYRPSDIAEKLGVHRSQISRITQGTGAVNQEKLKKLAAILNIPEEKVLAAAGYHKKDSQEPEFNKLSVITDVNFPDASLFMWICCAKQPLKPFGIECIPQQTDWVTVPDKISMQENSVGFSNKRSNKKIYDKEIEISYWNDLCIYRGYSLFYRTHKYSEEPVAIDPPKTLQATQRIIQDIMNKEGRPIIVTMGADTAWQLVTPLIPELDDNKFKIIHERDPELALAIFKEQEVGALFLGSLPHKYKLLEQDNCVEIMNYQSNPFLFSINSLVCNEYLKKHYPELLAVICASWFEEIRKIRDDKDYCEFIFDEIIEFIEMNNYRKNIGSKEKFVKLFGHSNEEKDFNYELFPKSPSELIQFLGDIFIDISKSISSNLEALTIFFNTNHNAENDNKKEADKSNDNLCYRSIEYALKTRLDPTMEVKISMT